MSIPKESLPLRMLRGAAVRVTVYNWVGLDTLLPGYQLSAEEEFDTSGEKKLTSLCCDLNPTRKKTRSESRKYPSLLPG